MRLARMAAVTALAVLSTGCTTLYGFGANTYGQLGDGTRQPRSEPVPAARNPDWIQVDAGNEHACGIDIHHALYCWGAGEEGQLGIGTDPVVQTTPARVGSANDWNVVSAGGFGGSLPELDVPDGHTCGIRSGNLFCWGTRAIGTGAGSADTPTQVGTAGDWLMVNAGAFHTCGIRAVSAASGALFCWGSNFRGQLGDGTTDPHDTPIQVGIATDWVSVSASFSAHTCGIRGSGTLYCWGDNSTGQLGDGTTTMRLVPTQVGAASDWKQVSAGGTGVVSTFENSFESHTCGIRAGGALFCWGYNQFGQLGDTSTSDKHVPTREATTSSWKALSAGPASTCAVRSDSTLWCWGLHGQPDTETEPVQQLFDKWVAVSAGRLYVEALRVP